MSKNMTRKGLAFGAGAALIATGFAGAPAAAEVDDNAVSLLPRLGSEDTGLIDNVFDLETTKSFAAAAGSGNLKYLVSDPDGELLFDYDNDSPDTGTSLYTFDEAALTGDELEISGGTTATADLTFRTSEVQLQEGEEITITNADIDTKSIDLSSGVTIASGEADSGTDSTEAGDEEITIAIAADDLVPTSIATVTFSDLASGTFTDDDIADGTYDVTGFTDGNDNGFVESFTFDVATTDVSQAPEPVTAGNAVFTMDSNFVGELNGDHTISADDKTASSESFSIQIDDDTNDYLGDLVYDVQAIDFTTKSGGPIEDKLDDRDVMVSSAAPFAARTLTGLAYTERDADGNFVIDTGSGANATSSDFLRLASTSSDAHSVDVTAWIDENSNGKIDSTELSSSTRTITFVEFNDSGATLNFEQPAAGDTELVATLTFDSDFNAESIQASPGAPKVSFAIIDDEGKYYKATANSDVSIEGAFEVAGGDGHAMVFDDSDYPDVWSQSVTFAVDTSAQIDGSGSYTSSDGTPNGYTFVAEVIYDSALIGAETFKSIDSENVDIMFQPAPALDENVLLSSGSLLTDSDAEFKVRSETTSALEINSTLWVYNKSLADNLTDIAFEEQSQNVAYGVEYVPAGTVVNVEVSEVGSSLDSDSVISVNGEELTSGDDPIEFTTTTNSVGVASISLANSEGVAGDSVLVEYSVDGLVKTAKLTWGDPDDAQIVFGVSTTEVTVEQEGSVSVDFFAYDEFGKGLSSPDYQVLVDDYITSVGGSDAPKNLSLSNGVGTLTFDDESESNGSYTIGAELQVENSSADYEEADTGLTDPSIDVNVVSDASPAIVDLDAVAADGQATGPEVDIQTVPITNLDARFDSNAALAAVPSFATDENYKVTGTVKNANGVLLRGVEVTLSGADLGFNTGDMTSSKAQLYTTGSITVVTDNTGDFAVEVRSNIAGKHVVTATSGTGSDTTDAGEIDFNQAKATEGTDLDVSISPEQVTPQGTVKVTVSLRDDFGNPVEVDASSITDISKFGKNQTPTIKVEYDGDGIAFGLGDGDATNEDGLATFDVLLGIDDVDPNSVVVEYNADGIDSTTSDNYAVQASQASYGSMSAWTVDQGDGTAKVYVKFPTIGEKVRIGHQTGGSGSYETIFVKTIASESDSALTVNAEGSYIVRTIDLEDGTNRIRVTVGDSTEVQVRYNE